MTAATVVSTCSLKVRSETSRLLRAIRICRAFTAGPKPWKRYCVSVTPSVALVAGLKSARGLLAVVEVLFNPRFTVVPVRKLCCTPKLEVDRRCTSSLLPVTNALLCGVVWCAQLRLLTTAGSRLGIDGPEDCSTLLPTAEAVAELAWEAAFWFVPGVVPELLTDALLGPAVTVVETPRANPPASACITAASASCGPYR